MKSLVSHKVCVAPMMDWTDRHCRHFLRLLSKHTLLYTEMVTSKALLHGDTHRLLQFNPSEYPLALQLGGNQPKELAAAAKLGEKWGYDEINLNVGCPSDRVQQGDFGACLMLQPKLVYECILAMQAAVDIPVTVKCRIGIDREESYNFLHRFVTTVAASGCRTFIIHARNAWLQGLSPKENRTIPPLRYDFVYRLKTEFPHLQIIINGGIKTYDEIEQHLHKVDGVMLGREAYHNPYILSEMDHRYFNDNHFILPREKIVQQMIPYITAELQKGIFLKHITRHMLGLLQGEIGAKHWRRTLSTKAVKANAGIDILQQALSVYLAANKKDNLK